MFNLIYRVESTSIGTIGQKKLRDILIIFPRTIWAMEEICYCLVSVLHAVGGSCREMFG